MKNKISRGDIVHIHFVNSPPYFRAKIIQTPPNEEGLWKIQTQDTTSPKKLGKLGKKSKLVYIQNYESMTLIEEGRDEQNKD